MESYPFLTDIIADVMFARIMNSSMMVVGIALLPE